MNGNETRVGACILAGYMNKMVPFYRDILDFHANWDGGDFAEFETASGALSFFMYGRKEFAKAISENYIPSKGINQIYLR